MSVFHVSVSLTHRSLMNKTKYELASLVMSQNEQATVLIRDLYEAMQTERYDQRVAARVRSWLGEDR